MRRRLPFPHPRAAMPSVVDGALAIALGGTSLAYLSGVLPGMVDSPGIGWTTVGLTALQTLPLGWRRRAPFVVWLAVTAAAGAWATLHYGETMAYLFAAPFALGNVAAIGTRRAAATAAALVGGGFLVLWLVAGANPLSAEVVLAAAMFATAWVLGDNVRRRRAYTALVEDRAARMERAREEHAQRLVLEERTRIARELHDVVAHHVSLIAVQAETGPYLVERGPDRAAEGFAAIGTTARTAMTEMRRLLGVLRDDPGDGGEASARAPQPGIGDLAALVDAAEQAGLAVDLQVGGEARPLPPGLELSAYRIVQEALTNVRKHAPATRATVAIDYGADALRLRVADDGTDGPPPRANGGGGGSGQGLVGMRERVTMLGGRLEAGPAPGGGFVVTATMPLEARPQ